jgi:hypothetical protein
MMMEPQNAERVVRVADIEPVLWTGPTGSAAGADIRQVNNWDEHLAKLRDFWSSVVLMSGRYHGQPMQAHMPLAIEPPHFDRRLSLFEHTTSDICPPTAAALRMFGSVLFI